MAFRAGGNSFAAGVIGRQVRARNDTIKYQTGLDEAYNVLILPAGGIYNRPGFLWGGNLKDSTSLGRVVPFTFSINQSYALEFTDELMRVYYDGGLVLRPELVITAATNTNPLTVTSADHGYQAGWDIYFLPGSILGMTELNGLTLRVLSVTDDVVTLDADATGWGVFTSSTGGVAGGSAGGTGGEPPVDPDAPLPPFPDDDPPPETCVWAESWVGIGLMAGDVKIGSPLRKMLPDGSGAFNGQVDAVMFAYAPGYRLRTETNVIATISDSAPVPVMRDGAIVYVKGMALAVNDVVAVEDGLGFRWEPVVQVESIGQIRVAKITTGNGIYGAGDHMGRYLFTHNIKQQTPLDP